MSNYETIFSHSDINFSFIFEKNHKDFNNDYFRDMGKLLKKEKNQLLDDLFIIPNEYKYDLELIDLNFLKAKYLRLPPSMLQSDFFSKIGISENNLINENIRHISFLIEFNLHEFNLNTDFESMLCYFLSEMFVYSHLTYLEDGDRGRILVFSTSYMYLLLESHFNQKKIIFDRNKNIFYFEIVNQIILKMRTLKLFRTWGKYYDKISDRHISFRQNITKYNLFLNVEYSRNKIINNNNNTKYLDNLNFMTEYIYYISFMNDDIYLMHLCQLKFRFYLSMKNYSNNKLTLHAKFNWPFKYGTIMAIYLFSYTNISLKNFSIGFVESTEKFEINNFFKVNFSEYDIHLDVCIIPFCKDFSSYENLSNFFKENQGKFIENNIEGFHLRNSGEIIIEMEFEEELKNEIYINILNIDNAVFK